MGTILTKKEDENTVDFEAVDFTACDFGMQYDLDIDLFDIKELDDNEFNRYMRPKFYDVPQKYIRYNNAEKMAEHLKWTDERTRYDCFISGNFIFGDFIEAFLVKNQCEATEMIISTLSMSQENIDSLSGLMQDGYIDNLTLIISDYFFSHERRSLIPYIYEQLDKDDRFQLVVAGVHTKTCQFTTKGGKKIVMHGSSNLRSSANIELFTIEQNPELYDFYKETFDILTEKYKTINKAVRAKDSWEKMEKWLLKK